MEKITDKPVTVKLRPLFQEQPAMNIKLEIIVKADIKKDTPDEMYTKVCNLAKRQGKLVDCGPLEDKWIIYRFESEQDMNSWMAQGIITG